MAGLGTVSTQSLPRFLLPKLSWKANSFATQGLRPLSTAPLSRLHDSELSIRRRYYGQTRQTERQQLLAGSRSSVASPQRRDFHATSRQARDHHFDTLKFVQRLKEEGFTEDQSTALMKVLSDVIEERYVREGIAIHNCAKLP
jgi:hypothetical protein